MLTRIARGFWNYWLDWFSILFGVTREGVTAPVPRNEKASSSSKMPDRTSKL
jgi:hypothetical protein